MDLWHEIRLGLGVALGVLAGAILCWALLRDRMYRSARGRRCVRCCHDMTGVPGRTCPECGTLAKSEKVLSGYRVRRGGIAMAVLITCAAIVTTYWSSVSNGKWMAFSPMWMKAAVWPELGTTDRVFEHLIQPLQGPMPNGVTKRLLAWSCERGMRSSQPRVVINAKILVLRTEADPALAAQVEQMGFDHSEVESERTSYRLRRAGSVAELSSVLRRGGPANFHAVAKAIERVGNIDPEGVLSLARLGPNPMQGSGFSDTIMIGLWSVVGQDARRTDLLFDQVLMAEDGSRLVHAPSGFSDRADLRAIVGRALARGHEIEQRVALSRWVWRLNDVESHRKRNGATDAEVLKDFQTWAPQFVAAMCDTCPELREAVRRDLSNLGDDRIEDLLLRRAATDPTARANILDVLSTRGYVRRVPISLAVREFALSFMRDPNKERRFTARRMLGGMPASLMPQLASVFDDPNPDVRRDAFELAENLQNWSDDLHASLQAIAQSPTRPEEDRVGAKRAVTAMEKRREELRANPPAIE